MSSSEQSSLSPPEEMKSLSVGSSSETNASTSQEFTPEEKFRIVRSVGEECIQDDELLDLLTKKPRPICYDGFEPSGRMHIAQGVMKTMNVNKLTSAGCIFKIWIADWFAMMNDKMGGDMKKIRVVGEYFIEIWKAAGMDLEGGNVEFLWASEEISSRCTEYLPIVVDIARKNTIARLTSCGQIMGRTEKDESIGGAQVLYPCMQCADIFFLKADICQMGKDQMEVNVLAREYCDAIKRENKPIILSHHMLPGLQEEQDKMSKSDPSSAIYMEDEEAEVNVKIKKAFCPPKVVKGNPCLEYIKYIVLPWFKEFKVERSPKNGGDKTYTDFEGLVADYVSGQLHPGDLKPSLSKALNKILQPVRDHFANDARAKDLLKRVKGFTKQKIPSRGKLTYPQSSTLSSSEQNSLLPSEEIKSLSVGSSETNASASQEFTPEEKFRIVRSIGEECIQDDELLKLLTKKPQPICYDGFEPSGRMHIAQGVMKTINVNKLTSVGCKVEIWIADWFAMMNDKMGGDLEKIRVVGEYFIEIWKAAGMDLEGGKVEFLFASDEISSRCAEYLPFVMDIALKNTLTRLTRCVQIMGRTEKDGMKGAQVMYPCMQCADIFFLKADICQLGMDQRKVNVLAREYCDAIKRKNKPIILSHHMLPGLQEGQDKMSKSDPSSAIYMEDEEAEVNVKIKKAFCPPKVVKGNPCLEYIKYMVIPWFKEFKVEQSPENGGDKIYRDFDGLVADYGSGQLHPDDLKPSLSKALNKILQPVRDHFARDARAKDLLKRVKSFRVTR